MSQRDYRPIRLKAKHEQLLESGFWLHQQKGINI